MGPKGTPFEEGVFQLYIQFSDQYPFTPPKMRFITPIYHCNISSSSGAISLDILQDRWSPALTLEKVMVWMHCLSRSVRFGSF